MRNLPRLTERELKKLSKHELIKLLTQQEPKQHTTISLPLSIFIKTLGPLESICKYLKENKHLSFHNIATLLQRDDRTIWASYHNAQKKQKKPFIIPTTVVSVPLTIIKNRTLSALENIVTYLKEHDHLNFHDIATLLQRDDRTIWTVYHRAKKKLP